MATFTFQQKLDMQRRQLAGVEKKAATYKLKRDREPYLRQAIGLQRSINKLEQLISVRELGSEESILANEEVA